MVVHKPKAAPPVRMEELRALNMLKLDPDDAKARIELAQKPRGIVPSGKISLQLVKTQTQLKKPLVKRVLH